MLLKQRVLRLPGERLSDINMCVRVGAAMVVGGRHGNKAEHGAATLQLRLCGNCTLRDGWLSPRLSCCGQAADWLQGDDTHANAVPPAHTSPSAEIHKPEKEKKKAERTHMGGRRN